MFAVAPTHRRTDAPTNWPPTHRRTAPPTPISDLPSPLCRTTETQRTPRITITSRNGRPVSSLVHRRTAYRRTDALATDAPTHRCTAPPTPISDLPSPMCRTTETRRTQRLTITSRAWRPLCLLSYRRTGAPTHWPPTHRLPTYRPPTHRRTAPPTPISKLPSPMCRTTETQRTQS